LSSREYRVALAPEAMMAAPTPASEYHILIAEDDADERQALARVLANAGYHVSTAESADQALSYLDESIHFVVTDLEMGDVSGLDLLKYWKAKRPETMFLMMTGHGSTQSTIDAIKAGAYHYMTKPLDINALLIMLQNMTRQHDDSRNITMLQNRLDEKCGLSNIVGNSPQMQRVFQLIRRSSRAFSTVLILGESGTGKELVAEAIHQHSPRRNGHFNAFNCAAMPASLVESELFGHEKGAFTGAVERRMGRFEAAHGGTLFIDEIGDLDISLQVKLLRIMENRTVTPVGGTKEIKVDTRVLAATSRDIRDLMAKGQFREDLYYRLNVITIELPPLRDRIDDVPQLVRRFMDRVNAQNGSKVSAISPDLIDALQQYHWPGNVRELLNVVERMIVLTDKESLDIDDLPAFIRNRTTTKTGALDAVPAATGPLSCAPANSTFRAAIPASPSFAGRSLREPERDGDKSPHVTAPNPALEELLAGKTVDELEKMAIDVAMRRFQNNRTRAAHALGISVRTLQRKLNPNLNEPGKPIEGAPPAPFNAISDNPLKITA
jgi:DNA-binding NtrC family response regulator